MTEGNGAATARAGPRSALEPAVQARGTTRMTARKSCRVGEDLLTADTRQRGCERRERGGVLVQEL